MLKGFRRKVFIFVLLLCRVMRGFVVAKDGALSHVRFNECQLPRLVRRHGVLLVYWRGD